MMRLRSTILVAILTVAGTSGWAQGPGEPSRGDRERARELFEEGVERATAGDFAGAIESFRASYDLNPRPVVLINIGSCQQQVGDPRGAIESFRAYLDLSGDDVPDDRRAQIEAQIEEIERSVTYVDVQVDQPGAMVTVEGEAVGSSPLAAPVRVEPGIVEIRARKPGFDEAVIMTTAVAGETRRVNVTLVASAESPPVGPAVGTVETPPTGGEEEPSEFWSWRNPWIWVGVGVVVVGATVTATVLAWPEDESEVAADWSVWGR